MSPAATGARSKRAVPLASKPALWHDERGTSSVEFTVLFTVICVACVLGWRYMGEVIVRIILGD